MRLRATAKTRRCPTRPSPSRPAACMPRAMTARSPERGGRSGSARGRGQFGGVVSSAGLTREPFDDVVYGVAAGDEVIFVVAVQNAAAGARAFDVRLRATMPSGFVTPSFGTNLSVTDGAGTVLGFSGDLFGSGLLLSSPIAAYDPNSGQNVVLITYSLVAGAALPGPFATVTGTAAITRVAAASGGADLSAGVSQASTSVVTAAPTPVVQAETGFVGGGEGAVDRVRRDGAAACRDVPGSSARDPASGRGGVADARVGRGHGGGLGAHARLAAGRQRRERLVRDRGERRVRRAGQQRPDVARGGAGRRHGQRCRTAADGAEHCGGGPRGAALVGGRGEQRGRRGCRPPRRRSPGSGPVSARPPR